MVWKDDRDLRSCSQTKQPHSFISIYLACRAESFFFFFFCYQNIFISIFLLCDRNLVSQFLTYKRLILQP